MVRPPSKVQAELQKLDLLTGQDTAQRSAYLNGSAELSPDGVQRSSNMTTMWPPVRKLDNSNTRNFARSRHLRVESHMERWATENECYYQGQGRCLVSSRVFSYFSCCRAIRSHQYVSTGWRPASWRLSLTSCNVVWTVPFWEQGMKHRGSSKASWFTQHQRSSACFIGRYGW